MDIQKDATHLTEHDGALDALREIARLINTEAPWMRGTECSAASVIHDRVYLLDTVSDPAPYWIGAYDVYWRAMRILEKSGTY